MFLIEVEYLRSILDYNPETGDWLWKVNKGRAKVGQKAGCISDGYRIIGIDGKNYLAHRLAQFYMTGKWPKLMDHKNRNRSDNRMLNLRKVLRNQNNTNRPKYKNNTSGLKGVSWHKRARKWVGQIAHEEKYIYLGLFDCPAAAYFSYIIAADKFHGEFACS